MILILLTIENNEFKNKFIDEYGITLIKYSLNPELRTNSTFLSKLSDFLCIYESKLPPITDQLIGFMLVLNK